MKPTTHRQSPQNQSPDRAGAALVLTLGMLVLLSGVVLAFLLTVKTEYGASKGYEGGTNARLLADTALNLVIGQIREASTKPDEAWISQPGLVRTFDKEGKPAKSYKLYSADSLVEDGSFDPAKGSDLPPVLPGTDSGNWKNQPGLWVDMNQPGIDLGRADWRDASKKLKIYPIFDGNHIAEVTEQGVTTGQMSLHGKIDNATPADIEGFKVEEYKDRQVTMPVKWLYILKDGTLVPAKASGTKGDVELVVPEEQQKTAQGEANTVVGRVAFWTDDETAKVNINTASEGTYWDTPVANSQFGTPSGAPYKPDVALMYERDLAEMEGAQKEFQRYPGHPATTCLSTIFGNQLGLLDTVRGDRALIAEEIFKLIPRVSGTEYDPGNGIAIRDNSSASGSKRAGVTGARSTDDTAYPVSPDGERIYATIDEFLFSPRFATGVRTGWRLAPPAPAAANRDTTRETLEMARFFLSVSSKAPEQNLYNLPRISIWPLQSEPTRRTALDKAIAFCSTVGLKTASTALPFYFTRKDPESMTEDAKPKRNQELIEYLKGLTGRPVPGWDTTGAGATTFEKKYGTGAGTVSDRDQLLAQIFDYIRCTNLVDRTGDGEDPPVNASYTVPDQDGSYRTKRGQVVPIVLGQTRGFGRIATISELGLKIDNPDNAQNPQGNKLEVTLVPKLFCPLAGFSALANNFRITFKDIDITVGGEQPFTGTLPTMYDFGRMSQIDAEESKVGGTIGTESLIEPPNPQGAPPNWGAPPDSKRPKGTITVASTANGTLTIKGKVTAEISAPAKEAASNSGEPVIQTIKFNFPETKVDVPKKGESVIRSLVPVGNPSKQAHGLQGDMRLVAARKDVDDTFFAPAPDGNYDKKELKSNGTHTLRQGFRMGWGGQSFGSLVKGVGGYMDYTRPDIPGGIDGVVNSLGQAGDWDNGPAFVPDGPYCNKPDEGARRHLHAQNGSYAESSPPYIGWYWCPQDAVTQQVTFFSPNRQVSSPVMLGSLPTGIMQNKPWQTLLFRPAKYYLPGGDGSAFTPTETNRYASVEHPGSAKYGPPDHLLLDLFWMPVVEPYAISEPFATSGKINLNQQIAPFTNIKRTTGLRAVMKSVKITALNPDQLDKRSTRYIVNYKICGTVGDRPNDGGGVGVINRRDIDRDNTVKLIEARYDSNRPFVSASEICDIPLIPKDLAGHVSSGFTPTTSLASFDSTLKTFWDKHKLTGDNSLERPYSHIYPRLTTRSNSYTVHVRVQTLAQNTRISNYILKASQAQPTGEFRGSFLIERYLDANSANIVDKDGKPKTIPTSGDTTGLALGPYRFRVVSSKQFVP